MDRKERHENPVKALRQAREMLDKGQTRVRTPCKAVRGKVSKVSKVARRAEREKAVGHTSSFCNPNICKFRSVNSAEVKPIAYEMVVTLAILKGSSPDTPRTVRARNHP